MKDEIFGILEEGKCPQCGSKRVECHMQYGVDITRDMKGKIIRRHPKTGKRIKASNAWLAGKIEYGSEAQMGIYECKKCGWKSETLVT